MLTDKQLSQLEKERLHSGRKLFCKKCRTVLRDHEPYASSGSFLHKENDCANSGKSFDWEPSPRFRMVNKDGKAVLVSGKLGMATGIVQWLPKSDRRARARGAKLASKHRPR